MPKSGAAGVRAHALAFLLERAVSEEELPSLRLQRMPLMAATYATSAVLSLDHAVVVRHADLLLRPRGYVSVREAEAEPKA